MKSAALIRRALLLVASTASVAAAAAAGPRATPDVFERYAASTVAASLPVRCRRRFP
jgi:hypothetical protein